MERGAQGAYAEKPQQPVFLTVLLVCGGGIVGFDYAQWLDVNVYFGIVAGALISFWARQILYGIYKDPGNEIENFFMKAGAFLGGAIGFYIGLVVSNEWYSGFVGAAIVAVVGYNAGKLVASTISFAAFFLISISQGPVGFILRNALKAMANQQ